MNDALKVTTAGILLISSLTSCSQTTEVTTDSLADVVARDGVPFDVQSIPEQVLDRLSQHKLVRDGP